MPGANVAVLPTTSASASSTPATRKPSLAQPERKYKCQFCNRAFSRSEHRSRHERSHTKERPFKCMKCRSTFVRRDLLLRHDRTVHAKDGGVPLHSDGKRRAGANGVSKSRAVNGPSKSSIAIDASTLSEQIEASSEGAFDVEHAAMLVADLHHKAMMHDNASAYESGPSMSYTPTGPPMVDPAVNYASSAATLPTSAPWDAFASQTTMDAKAHSAASSASASFDPQHPFANVSAIQAQPSLSPPSPGLTYNDFIPAPQSVVDPLPPFSNGPAALNALSTTHTKSAYTNPPQNSAGFNIPRVHSDEERNILLDNIRAHDSERAIPEGFRVPNLSSLNRYLSTYFTLFHHHLPFLHPASFNVTQVSPALLLAVLSIGALYAFDQDQAYLLHIGSKVLVNQFLQNKENFSSRKCPLWTMQGSLLNMIFASWSGDPKGLEWACSIKSLLANMVAGNRYELKLRQDGREGAQPTRNEWIEDEGCRRTYYAVYIFFGLLTMTYNHTPAISFNEFENLQLPSQEALWNSKVTDEATWQEQLKTSPAITFMDAHEKLFQGETLKYSAFATRVMINALFLEVWYHKRSPEALQDVVTEYKLRLALETWEKSLDLCEPEADAVPLSAPHKGHPLIFNAKAMFRNARLRLEVDLKTVQEALRYHDHYEVAAAMSNARDRVKRSSEMIKVIEECYNCIETAVRQGVRWVARTSPTNWSIEHPLCGMDLMITLTLWLYRLEHDEEAASEEEMAMYLKVRMLFDKDAEGAMNSQQLSSTVAHLWGSMLDEVVVWGITRLMGEAFRLHSQALVGYVDDVEASSNVSTPSMISQGGDEESVY
ncbi:fungal-specific transcription factor domain-containing protein [Annulohypoxylon maeteangense]|uniref:fungal-specific transcription factor domain-containing protein n=1 Tax=Annulohypoxylon maeteangense TaxID=1927788 RepID=UPI00200839E8|nr:fungal-specific transcription factor domain-containing protein [Annulohypoxylon maeteangense]KAI0881922.1 fungal-specific transcription factor domain-containing protein [Annulohypoxylon maeteangense]